MKKLNFINGGAVYIGKDVSTNLHQHNAIQIVISFNQTFKIITPHQIFEDCKFVIITENIQHQFVGPLDEYQVFIYLDPLHRLSKLLKNIFSLNDNVILADNYLSHIPLLKEWLEKDNNEIQEITKNIIEKITNNLGVDTIKDNRILKSIEYLTYNINKSIKISEVADFVCLSESRFAHLFKLQVGIPFRRYILWLRIQKTLLSFLDGNSFTSASYDGGFTDISHFNRTFKEMFGNTPSAILKS